ncbi:rab11 family-interacting protein 1 [Betta splendens]|uniref:Rab11 family-interacting protein 1 n=1 Tax=Betta splendens TaxID=158456 RepID=A0A6P7NNC0_BETSP|nr:rab11 family-interacting protein 1 [Betta splendens]
MISGATDRTSDWDHAGSFRRSHGVGANMMSLIDLDDDQGWVPTHVNVTVLRARGLRTKGKHGSRYLYTIIQVGKEKYTTGLVEKAEVPEWNEECCFELLPGILEDGGRSAYPPGSGDLVLTVMHRVLIGLDVFLGQTIIPLDHVFQQGTCPRDEWFKLNSKAGRREKERGDLQVTVKFTRNNMTASMFDLTVKDKPRSAFGKLKDRVTGRKRGDVESSSAIVPGRYAALAGPAGPAFGQEAAGGGGAREAEGAEDKRSKMKDFFKGRLRKSSDTRSCTSLASESSMSSMASDNPVPPPALDLLSDPPSSPIYTSKVRADPYGESDLAKKAVLTSHHTTNVLTHKRAFSDEASKITAFPRTNPAVESLKGQTMTQSKSSLCINGSHVYDSEPSTPRSSGALPSKLVLLEKCSPLSRSLQNLTRKSEDRGPFAERCWSTDKAEKGDEGEAQDEARPEERPVQAAPPVVSSAASSPEKGRRLRKTLFSGGRSDSLPTKSDPNPAATASEGRLRGWFGSGDSQNRPRLEVSPKVESSSDAPPPLPPRSPVPPQCSSASPSAHVLPDDPARPLTPSSSPSSPPISPSNPFLPHMQHNPFFEELIAEESQRTPPLAPCSSPGSSPFHFTTVASQPCTSGPNAPSVPSTKRERPRPVARQISLPAFEAATQNSTDLPAPRSMSESAGEWEESFDAFASSRLNSPKGGLHPKQPRTSLTSSHRHSHGPAISSNHTGLQAFAEEPPPLPPRRPVRTPVSELYSDGWLHRGQELAVHKEAYLLSQTGVASLQRGREGGASPDPPAGAETSDPVGVRAQAATGTSGFSCQEELRKFRYEPLQDDNDCWGGLLFEQDLYGRTCKGNYGKPKATHPLLSLCTEETPGNNVALSNSGLKTLLDTEISVTELLNMSNPSSLNADAKVPQITNTVAEETADEFDPHEPNNNVSFSLTLEDLNMNVNNSDFSFIDSDGSSQSEAAEVLRGPAGPTWQPPQLVVYRTETPPEELLPLKDTYIPETDSSFEITPSSNKLCKVSPVCQDGPREPTSRVPAPPSPIQAFNSSTFPPESSEGQAGSEGVDFDDNGNLDVQSEPFPVVSARFRPRAVNQRRDAEFDQLLSLVQNISRAGGGPWSRQSATPAPPSGALREPTGSDLQSSGDSATGKRGEVSFEDLHARVAPSSRAPRQAPGAPPPSNPLPAANAHLHPAPLCCASTLPSCTGPSAGASATLAVAPYISSSSTTSSSSSTSTSTSDQPLVDARHSLLPEETQPASSLPRQESRSHPVKPLTSSQSEKKEGRSVLEKLKSTIHPGRSAQQAAAEPEKTVEVAVDNSAQYQHLTNMELISLLLQQEMDMQKQQAASEQQGAQLQKCEAELRKVKSQVRDLEDYIDNLLLRIMEQTPTLLQVRTRHK